MLFYVESMKGQKTKIFVQFTKRKEENRGRVKRWNERVHWKKSQRGEKKEGGWRIFRGHGTVSSAWKPVRTIFKTSYPLCSRSHGRLLKASAHCFPRHVRESLKGNLQGWTHYRQFVPSVQSDVSPHKAHIIRGCGRGPRYVELV